MPTFLTGRELSRRFYEEAVRPLLEKHMPGLPHAAAHLGKGSDVLGFDTEMSRDHDWGPAVFLFLRDEEAHLAKSIREMLSQHLPYTFDGYPIHYTENANDAGTFAMQQIAHGSVNHRVKVLTVRAFAQEQLAYDVDQPPDVAEWLTFPAQVLREVTAGAVHHDGIGELTELRARLAWYPRDIWYYLLAAGWQRIGQEEHLMSRAGFVGDELGSALIGSRLVHDIMSLCFLMERQYAPYPKWFGTAFQQLTCAEQFSPLLWRAHAAPIWQEREATLCEAYMLLARLHNTLGITEARPDIVTPFFGRPFKVIKGETFAHALVAQITDPQIMRIASRRLIGSIDQFSDNTDLRAAIDWQPALRKLYE